MSQQGVKVQFIRCDNAGENHSCQQKAFNEGMGLTFEFASRSTPQHNGRIERKFHTLYGRLNAMLNQAGLPKGIRKGIWAEAAYTATLWENALVHDKGIKPAYTQFHQVDAPYVKNLHPFGAMGTVLDPTKKDIKAKLVNKGQLMMFVGPAKDHASDSCKMWNMKTKRFIITRDVLWLGKTYGAHFKTSNGRI